MTDLYKVDLRLRVMLFLSAPLRLQDFPKMPPNRAVDRYDNTTALQLRLTDDFQDQQEESYFDVCIDFLALPL